ncbi:hypothetical protein Bbelb_421150 [Branchiostoma belcheri]|nr:hypothetical protein Bbelb_421150 [Branchiostoma belcheri]
MSKHVLDLVHLHDTITQTGAVHIRQIRSTTATNIDGSAASIIPLHPPRRNSHLPAMAHINSANSEHIAFSWLVCDSCNLTRISKAKIIAVMTRPQFSPSSLSTFSSRSLSRTTPSLLHCSPPHNRWRSAAFTTYPVHNILLCILRVPSTILAFQP